MKNMKVLMGLLVVSFALVGCGKESSQTGETTAAVEGNTPTVRSSNGSSTGGADEYMGSCTAYGEGGLKICVEFSSSQSHYQGLRQVPHNVCDQLGTSAGVSFPYASGTRCDTSGVVGRCLKNVSEYSQGERISMDIHIISYNPSPVASASSSCANAGGTFSTP